MGIDWGLWRDRLRQALKKKRVVGGKILAVVQLR
jgi:hypothetical protein